MNVHPENFSKLDVGTVQDFIAAEAKMVEIAYK